MTVRCLFCNISHRKCSTSAVSLANTAKRKPTELLKDVKSTGKADLPTVIKADIAVMVCIKVVAELNTHSSQFVLQLIKGIYHFGHLIIIILGVNFYAQLLTVVTAFACSLDELNEIINLEWCPDIWVSNDYMFCRFQIVTKSFL